jgi:hypothetical protein
MRRTSTSAIGAFHPIVFFMFVYGISLFLALFVCRTVYYSLNDNQTSTSQTIQAKYTSAAIGATALR